MTTRFMAAFVRLARAANSSEFSQAKQMQYLMDYESIADDAEDLVEWSGEVLNLARLAFAAGSLDAPSLLIVESLTIEFRTELDAILEQIELLADDDLVFDDDEPFDAGFFAELDIDLDTDEADMLSDEFWSIIDANFEPDDASAEAADDEVCTCVQCTGAADAVSDDIDTLADTLAKAVYDLTHEAYLTLNEKFRHPALRNDATVAAYASDWEHTFRAAAAEGSYELADALVRLTELTDDTLFALIAKNASNVDAFAARTTACFESARRMLALV